MTKITEVVESRISEALSSLPEAPWSVSAQFSGDMTGDMMVTATSQGGKMVQRTFPGDTVPVNEIEDFVLIVKGVLYGDGPVHDMEQIDKQMTYLNRQVELLGSKLEKERMASSGWEERAQLYLARLAKIRKITRQKLG